MNPPVEIVRCPVHGIPDCSALLNGCSIPSRLAAAYAAGRAAEIPDAAVSVQVVTNQHGELLVKAVEDRLSGLGVDVVVRGVTRTEPKA